MRQLAVIIASVTGVLGGVLCVNFGWAGVFLVAFGLGTAIWFLEIANASRS